MMFTGRFANPKLKSGKLLAVPICLWTPRWPLKYETTKPLRSLAPKQSYLRAPRDEYTKLYLDGLAALSVDYIHCLFEALPQDGRPVALLCYEDLRKPELWCHRRLFADWWLSETGEDIPELEEEPLQAPMF